jgi:CO/xanthine dehydrogenase Mo-binding subunit
MVTAKWDYASDIVLPEMLYARVLGSPYAHAKITSIDTSKAEALPGVKAIVTYKDHPTLFPQEVTWWGCQVAAVAATDMHISDEALSLIDVKYEVLPFTLDAMEAFEGKVSTGVFPPKNIFGPIEIKRGDWTKGFAEADVIFEDTVGWSIYFQHLQAEPYACVAKWDGDYVTIWIGSQNPFGARDAVASALAWSLNKVRMISHGTGGGFGDKHRTEQNAIAALLAKKAGLPVKLVCDGYERTTQTGHQYADYARIKIGAKKDGTFTAIEMTMYSDNGGKGTPYSYRGEVFGGFWCSDAISPLQLSYTCPNAHFIGYTVGTNKPPVSPWRCVGEPGGNFLMDIVIDELAEKLGIDPVELRLKNCFKGKIGELKDQDSGLLLSSMAFDECFTKAADAIGWKTKWHKPGTKTLPDGRLHGIGISALVCNKGYLATGSGTVILMTTDGKAHLQTGISSANGGSTTTLAFIAAEVLGLASMDDITLFDPGDTATTQDSGQEGGSTRTITAGAGTYMAALDVKNQLFEIAAPMLGVKPEELEAKGGKIYVKADPTKALTIKDVCTEAYKAGVRGTNLIGRGYQWWAPKHVVRTECVEIAEVAVDPETGAVEVLSMVCADDLGRAIHWKGSENQCEGGMIQCIAQAVMDQDQILDKATGATLNANLLEQRYCTILDWPDDLKTILVEPIDVVGPYGCKGLGEPPVSPGHGAIINAIYNATGKWIKKHPATEPDVLKALGKA